MKQLSKAIIRCLFAVSAALLLTGNPVHAEGEWYEDYEYVLNPTNSTIQLKKYNGAGGNIVVPGYATIDGVTYQTLLGGDFTCRTYNLRESLTGIEIQSGTMLTGYCSGLFGGDKNLTYIIFPDDLDTSGVTNMSYMFQSCKALESLDLSMFDTAQVKDFTGMFEFCTSLRSLDMTGFDTSSAQSMRSMFDSCYALESIDVTHFNTSGVTDFAGMFSSCTALTSLDVTHLQTSSAERMNSMFNGCSALESLDVHTLDTSHVTNMSLMFAGCKKLQTLDLSTFQTENVTLMEQMFSGCQNLTSLDLSSFRTGNVTSMKGMFTNLFAMTTLDVSHFDTSNVTDMFGLFTGVRNYTLDLSGFHTEKVTDMRNIFSSMPNLASIDLSGFDMSGVTMAQNMFSSCTSLVEIKTPKAAPTVSTQIVGNYKFAEKDEEGYYKEERYTDFVDAPVATMIYRVDTYKIAFYANSGNGTMPTIDVQCGMPIRLPLCTFTRDGYFFAGWGLSYALTTTAYEDGAEVIDLTRKNQTYNLYARWRRPASFSVALPAMLTQTVQDGSYFTQIIDLNVTFSGNTGDYLKITPTVTDLTDGKGITIPMQASISTSTYRNGGGVGSIWVRSTNPMKNLPAGDYAGTLTVNFKSEYN